MVYSVLNFVEDDYNDGGAGIGAVTAPTFTVTAGSCLLAWVRHDGSDTTVSLNDTVGSNDTWTQITAISSGNYRFKCYRLYNAASGSMSLTATFGVNINYPAIGVVELSGIATSSAVVGFSGNSQTNPGTSTDGVTSGSTGTLTSQPAGVFAMTINGQGATAVSAGTGYTSQDSYRAWDYGTGTLFGRFEHKRVTATTAVDATFTAGSDTNHQTIVVALAEASASTAVPVFVHHYKQQGIQ